jgi:hypothetical protein
MSDAICPGRDTKSIFNRMIASGLTVTGRRDGEALVFSYSPSNRRSDNTP